METKEQKLLIQGITKRKDEILGIKDSVPTPYKLDSFLKIV